MFTFLTSQYVYALLLLGFPLALLVLMVFLRRAHRIGQLVSKPKPIDKCECGYLLKNLSVPRCPECGRVLGFQATAEELGLTVEQLEKVQAARQRRLREGIQ